MIKLRQAAYQHPAETKDTIGNNPSPYVPQRASMMNTHSQAFDFITMRPEKGAQSKIKASKGIQSSNGYQTYAVCGDFHQQRLQNPRYREHFKTIEIISYQK